MDDQIDRLVDRWQKTRLLDGIQDSHIKSQVAILLENQYEYCKRLKQCPHYLMRVSIPIVRRLYDSFLPNKIVSVQAFRSPCDFIRWEKPDGQMEEMEGVSKARRLKTRFNYDSKEATNHPYGALEYEAELTCVFAADLNTEFSQEVLRDLKNNSGTQLRHQYTTPQNLLDKIQEASDRIGEKIGHEANWIVVSSNVFKVLSCLPLRMLSSQLFPMGIIKNKWMVYEDPAADNTILLGYKGEGPYAAGYAYCPYVPFNILEEHYCVTRNGKRLHKGGANYYATVSVK